MRPKFCVGSHDPREGLCLELQKIGSKKINFRKILKIYENKIVNRKVFYFCFFEKKMQID